MKLSTSLLGKYILLFLVINIQVVYSMTDKVKPSRAIAKEMQVIVEDTVYKIEKVEDGLRVYFSTHAGVYYLKQNSKHFKALSDALRSSIDLGESIEVKANATTLEVHELILKTD